MAADQRLPGDGEDVGKNERERTEGTEDVQSLDFGDNFIAKHQSGHFKNVKFIVSILPQ